MASFLPQDIIIQILSCLPVKTLIRFRCVCKDWFDLIKSPSFVQIHLRRATENGNFNLMDNHDGRVYSIKNPSFVQIHQIHLQRAIENGNFNLMSIDNSSVNSIDYEPHEDEVERLIYPFHSHLVKFLGSCHGLIYLTVLTRSPGKLCWDEINCLWNPSTKEYFKFPGDDDYYYPQGYGYNVAETYGFGYDCKTGDYKVVTIVQYYKFDGSVKLHIYHHTIIKVYTLRSNSWRRIEDIPYELSDKSSPGIYVNGALHWVAKHGNRTETSSEHLLISFDLGDEEYLEVPQANYSDNNFDMNAGVLEGNLCIIRTDISKTHVDLWMMKEYGVRESWNKLFTITQSMGIHEELLNLTPIKILKTGEILLNICGLMSYDPMNKQVRRLDIPKKTLHYPWIYVVAYVGSLISLTPDKYFLPKGGGGASRT